MATNDRDGINSDDDQQFVTHRQRTMTEKGKSYQADLLRRQRRSLESSIKRQMKHVRSLLTGFSAVPMVNDEVKLLNDIFREVREIHYRLQSCVTEEEFQEDDEWFEIMDSEVLILKEEILIWNEKLTNISDEKNLQCFDNDNEPTVQSSSQKSVSMFHEGHQKDQSRRPADNGDTDKRFNLDSNATPFQPSCPPKEVNLNEMMCRLLQQSNAPEVKIDCFEGDSMEYQYFMATFKEAVENKFSDNRSRLTRLIQHLRGEAKELVRHCVQEPSSVGYHHALKLLKEQYGDPYRVYTSYRKELQSLSPIKNGDSVAFRRFFSLLLKCKTSMTSATYERALDSPDLLRTLQLKLPVRLQDSWNRKSMKIRTRFGDLPSFQDFTKFIEDEMKLANDPMFSRDAPSNFDSKAFQQDTKKKIRSFATGVDCNESCVMCSLNHDLDDCNLFLDLDYEEKRQFVFRQRICFSCFKPNHTSRTCQRKKTCKVCRGSHPTSLHINKIKQSQSTTQQSAKSTTQQPAKPTTQQPAKPTTQQPAKPTTQQPAKTTTQQPAKTTTQQPAKTTTQQPAKTTTQPSANIATTTVGNKCTKIHEEHVSISVVPVWLWHSSDPTKRIRTYALLDNCSQGSFVTESCLKSLSLQGNPASIRIKTLNSEVTEDCFSIKGMNASSLFEIDGCTEVQLPKLYTKHTLPTDAGEVATKMSLQNYEYLHHLLQYVPDASLEVGLLIGANCVKALEPQEVINSRNDGPFAFKSRLGWCITGPNKCCPNDSISCSRISVSTTTPIKDEEMKKMMEAMYHHDFNEAPQFHGNDSSREFGQSIEDKRFIALMDEKAVLKNSHYVLPIPFRTPDVKLPNNRIQAASRAQWLAKKFLKNEMLHSDYKVFMDELLEKGYAIKVKTPAKEGKVWYVPHHGVYHPQKPGKIRIVFDCSATYNGRCLNKEIMQGPDLINSLVGVLCRFRENEVGVMGDVEKMFYQVKLPEEHQDFFRFLWWPDGDSSKPLQEYRMTVHTFGCVSSPSCANYAIKRTADDHFHEFGSEIANIVKRNFYVDDYLDSSHSSVMGSHRLNNVRQLCQRGGFNLVKFISNSREVLANIDDSLLSKSVKDIDISKDQLPMDRTLGVIWVINNDQIGFRIEFADKPLTRRGVLSTICSIYDPMGLASPFLLEGRKILQQLVKEKLDWDDQIPHPQRVCWEKWRHDIFQLKSRTIPRCYKPKRFGEVINTSLHCFPDASDKGYGVGSYLRFVNEEGSIATSLVMGKSRVAPMKQISVPRMELTAAVVSVRVSRLLQKELTYPDLKTFFWTDSQAVLGYISNEARRFHTFVANRAQFIRDNSNIDDWHHVKTDDTPGDDASRGLSITDEPKINRWFNGPDFLRHDETSWPIHTTIDVSPDDPEVKKKVIVSTTSVDIKSPLCILEERISSWFKLRRIVAKLLFWKKEPHLPINDLPLNHQPTQHPTMDDLRDAELRIIKNHQSRCFPLELRSLTMQRSVSPKSRLLNLDPFIDNDGLLRVGGRISKGNFDYSIKHPIIISNDNQLHVTIARWYHEKTNHCGRGITLNAIRSAGYWILGCTSIVKGLIFKCVTCKKLRCRPADQQMANLPEDRLQESAPFTFAGVDVFGPFTIKEGRKSLKRYGLLFTCLSSRAIHLESLCTLETDSFIQALRRLISRRGNVSILRSDRGTNFIGADRELRMLFNEMDHHRIQRFMQTSGGDWLVWKFNPPKSSHMGGIWERQIRSVRGILTHLMANHGDMLNDECFRTFLCEAECIVNSRPLTYETLGDAQSPLPISPMNLLTLKSQIVLPPPGTFEDSSLYCRRRWRRVQYLSNQFWLRWKSEYLHTLQNRTKWQNRKPNFNIGDVVLVKETNSLRNDWGMAIVTYVKRSEDGLVRSVTVKSKDGVFERPIHKLVLLTNSI